MSKFLGVSLLLFCVIISSFPHVTYAAESDIVINEIAAYEKTDHEWIEIYNKSSASVDITGWKFFEDDTNHTLTASRGDLVIEPGEYAVIADVAATTIADYASFTGTVIDSSWQTLNESGESIALKNKDGVVVEQFSYLSAPNHSLERVSATSNEYTASNWKEHATGNTIGFINSSFQSSPPPVASSPAPVTETSPESPPPSTPPVVSTPPPTPTPQAAPPSPAAWRPVRGDVVINELISDPTDGEKEWIELYNNAGRSVDLSGWSIEEGSKSITALSGILGSSGASRFLIVENPKGGLNNAGDVLVLRDDLKNIQDEVAYGNWDDGNVGNNAPKASDPFSIARKIDGRISFNNTEDFLVTSKPTKGSSNVILKEGMDENKAERTLSPVKDIEISEILPNPSGREAKEEFIELHNAGNTEVDLLGWQVVNGAGKKYTVKAKDFTTTKIPASGYFVITRQISGLALKNSGGDSVKLYQSESAEKPNVALIYREKAVTAQSYARHPDGTYLWTTIPTPGKDNVFTLSNTAPEIEMTMPTKATISDVIVFDASDSIDAEGDVLKYIWQFGDGTTREGPLTTHHYEQEGLFEVTLTVADPQHEMKMTKKIQVSRSEAAEVEESQRSPTGEETYSEFNVVINEVLPDPSGADTSEFIELKNLEAIELDISGWSLDCATCSQKFVISEATVVKPQEIFLIPHTLSSLSLNNKADIVALYDREGGVVDQVDYDDPPRAQSMARTTEGDWLWTQYPTPGKDNGVDEVFADDTGLENDSVPGMSQVPAVLPRTSNVPHTTRRNSSVVVAPVEVPSLDKVREEPLGSLVKVRGRVSVEPGILGTTMFYLSGSGIQVYNAKKSFPKIAVGDLVEVEGVLAQSNDEMRIRTKDAGNIVVVEHGASPEPHVVEGGEINEDVEGHLVTVTGTISQLQWPTLYLDTGGEEVRVYVKKSTGIKKPTLKKGDKVAVTGVVSQTVAGYRVLPRVATDIVKQEVVPDVQESTRIERKDFGGVPTKNYLLAALIALSILGAGLMIQFRLSKK